MTDQVHQEPIQNCKAPADHLLKVVDLGPPQQPQKKTDGNTAFLRAARSGNLEKVLEFINANVDINTSNSNGLNALHLASKDGHVEVAAELLKRGANVDAATKKGNTALHIASLAGQEEVVKLLIEHGATVNLQSQSGFTPLYMAAQENHERVVRYLLNNGANQSLATEDGFTPLAVAMQQGHDKVVTELLENDTRGKIKLPALHIAAKKDDCKAAALLLQSEHNPDITSKSGFTPLHIASHYGNDAIASLLLAKGADVNYAAKHNITPLHVAAKWGRNNMVILLLDKGASIIAKTRDGLTPLHCAARSGHEQVVDTLLQRHAPITAKTKNGLAPLHMASQGDHVEAARVLLSHRAPVDDVTVDYLTALHVASHCGHVSVAKLLLDRKADPNARALNGFTPLHIACKKNRVKIVELLLKHGGSIEATTESGLSPLHVASFMGCMNIVIYLLQCGANPDVSTIRGETPLHLASRANQTDIIRILLRNNAQVDAKAREQQTPLHIASRLGNTDIVMLLLQHGANVDSVTKDLYTSLHIAAKEDQEEVAQALLEHNASMTATTKKGFTPLHLAAKYGRTNIATLLLQRGAPVDAQGKNGVTPLHVASHYDHQGIALLLLDKGASSHATAKNGHTPLHIAAKKNQMDIAAMLLEYGANAGAESKAGFTPLHLSAQEGHVDMTNLLLEHKADVNHSSKNGLTPLHLCAQEDCVDVATILVKNGADVNSVTKAGYSPLHIASHFGQLNMVRFLLSNKTKVDTATSTGYTPLHQAAQQGNSAIVAVLLDNGASPDTKNNQGQTALCIAQKLGYISVVEVLKNVTDNSKGAPAAAPAGEEKYKVVAPETMQENFMSDSEDEGGEDATNEQSYRYLTIDEMKSLGDDSLPIDTSKEDRYDTTAGIDESISPQHTFNQLNAAPVIDNVDVTRAPVIQTGFLVSFLVDAKGGAMRGCRHSGVRVIVPPQCVTMPTRVTCRYIRRDKPNHPPPPPLMEGEALASRILELGPVGVKFLGPVVIEVPNFAALRANEREIVILRSDNGETWREHTVDSSNEAVHDILSRSFDKDGNQIQLDEPGRITSIVTHDFPHYFAIVSRIRQEVHAIGPEGGMVSSSVVPQVQAVFPQGALTKKIKVGLQAQPIPSELTAAVLGNCVAVSPIVTIEPRRRKFHKPITLTLPVPQAANKGMINQYSGDAPTLRLLCSITGGTSRAQWEDVTGSTPLTFVKECVSFTTTVSARFWLMDIRDIAMATKKATELYREAIHIPFMAKFVVFAKRIDNNEARLRVFCMTDDKEDKTLESQEQFTEVAKSRDVEVLEGKKQLIELSGNLISVTKSGDQLKLGFNAFQENRLPFTVRIKDSLADPIGRMLFFKEQKPVKTSTPHPPICVLNIVLPETIIPDSDFADSPIRKYYLLNDTQGYHRSELKFSDISNLIGEDWEALAEKLGIRSSECKVIKIENPEGTARQSLVMLKQWHQRAGSKATANILESALLSIGREDIVQQCFLNTTQQKLPNENGLISHKIEDIHGKKNDVYSTDDDERKYTAEEKIIDETELKSVSERKKEIEKRLLDEQNNKKEIFKERSESEEKRQSSKQQSEEREIIKNVVHDEKDNFEPTKLTFQQKRLSFEKGYSVDKILSEGIAKDGEPVQTTVIEEQHDKSSRKEKSVEKDAPPKKEKSLEKVPQKEPSVEKAPKKETSVEEAPKKEPSVEKSAPKTDEPACQKPPRKDKQVEEKKPLPKEKSVEKVDAKTSQKASQKEKSPDTFAKKESVEPKIAAAIVKEKSVEKVTETFISKEKSVEEKVTEKPAQKDKPVQEKVAEKERKKDEKPLAKKDSHEKVAEKPAPKDDKVHEKPLTKDKSEEKIVEKFIQKEITIEEKISEKPVHKEEKIIKKEKSPEKDSPLSKPPTEEIPVGKEEKPLSFQEKRLSFEHGVTTVISSQTNEIKLQNDISEPDSGKEKRDSDARRDSELFEGVSLSLGKLEAKPIPPEQNFLSPKPLKTPPPSPAEFKESNEEWHKTDSLDSNRSNKSVAEIDTPLSENQTATSTESAEPTRPSVNNLNEDSVQKLPIPEHSFESITTESVSEIEEPTHLQITTNVHGDKSEQEKYNDQLIDMLIEQETAQLVASGRISYDSDSDEEIRKKYESFKPNGQSTVVEYSDDENEQVEISDTDVELLNYLSTGESKDENHIVSDHSTERSPQRKVAFRLNSDENELVYPGQTDSEESTSTSESSENSENSDEAPEPGANDDANHIVEKSPPKEEIKIINTQPTEVERKFERMASETLDDVGKVEGEFHKIVSQLSFEEVTDCLNAWDETESAAKHEIGEKPVRHEGDKQLSSTESDTRPPSQVLESDTDNQDNMDYFSKKKFWQSFESTGSEKSDSAPIPKPRSSISSVTSQDETPVAARRSTENIRSGFVSSKSESLQERHSDVERFRPSMKKVHSVTSYSTDSEAEYIANCGIEKLAYENVAFSEEDESVTETQELKVSSVKSKKLFFEQMQKDSSQESVTSPPSKKDENISVVKTTKIVSSEIRNDKDDVTSLPIKKDEILGKQIEKAKDFNQTSITSPVVIKDENAGIGTTTQIVTTETRIDKVDDSSQKNLSRLPIKKNETIKETPIQKVDDSSQKSVTSPLPKKDENTGLVKATQVVTTETRIDKVDDSSEKNLSRLPIKKNETIKETPTQKVDDSNQKSVTSPLSKKDENTGLVKATQVVTTETRIDKVDDSSQKNLSRLPIKKNETIKETPIQKVDDSSQKIVTSPLPKKDENTGLVKATQVVTTETRIDKVDDSSQKNLSRLPIKKNETIKESAIKKVDDSSHKSVTGPLSKKGETTEETRIEKVVRSDPKSVTSPPSKKDESIDIVGTTTKVVTVETRANNVEDSSPKSISSPLSKKDESIGIAETTTKVVTTETPVNKLKDSTPKSISIPLSKKDESIGIAETTTKVVTTETPVDKLKDSSPKSVSSPLSKKDENISIVETTTKVVTIETPVDKLKDSSPKSVSSPPSKKDEDIAIVETTTKVVTTETPVNKLKDSSPKIISSPLPKKDESIGIAETITKVVSTATRVNKVEDSSLKSVPSPSSKNDEHSGTVKTTTTTVVTTETRANEIEGSIPLSKNVEDTSIVEITSKAIPIETQVNKVDGKDESIKTTTSIETHTFGSLDESIDSTQSESDITPEDLHDKQFLMQDWESTNEMLENIAHEKERLSICYSERPFEHQIRFSVSEEHKLFNDIRSVSQDEYVDEALKEEVKVAAENLINEIEEELGKRPDIVECLLKSKLDELVDEIVTSSNDITDEDLKSTGTEADIPMPYGQDETTIESRMKMKISEASPTEYEIKYEQVEEFNVLESVDFEEQIIPEEAETSLRSTGEHFTAVCKNEIVKPSRIPVLSGKPSDVKSPPQRKSSEDEKSRTSTSPEYVQDFIEIRRTKNRKSGADFEPCSSSSESHYHSFEHSGTASRPLSSDVEGLLSSNVPGTTGSSEYETAASHDTSHDFHTAMSSASLHESIKSIDSESSGNLGSAEVSSEVSETLVASSAELEHDVDLPTSHYYDETKKSVFRRSPIEPYDNEIPMEIIKGTSHSFDMSNLHSFATDQKKVVEPGLSGHVTVKERKPEEAHEIDDKLLSSSEDVSCFSLTDGGTNLPTVIEVNSNESDKMDNSLISEQSLTMSANSNQFSTSSSDLKDDVEADKKNVDTNTTPQTHETYTSVSIITSTCEEHGRTNVCTQVTSKIDKSDSKDTICRDISADDIPNITISEHSTPPKESILTDCCVKDAPISPDSESFELIEQPDMMDDFVIVEEVAKEAFEQDQEGKCIRITEKRKSKNYDDDVQDVPPKTTSTLTKVEYYGGNDGCNFPIEGVPVEDKPSTDEEYENSPPNDGELYEHEVEEGKKWIEMQFQTDSEDAAAYEYNYERVPLEDIKEEDTDDMHSSKIGSVSSQISQSIGSLGSMKQSLSSTPDYDILAGKRYFTKSSDKDDISQGSLQEFERLEQLIALESIKSKLSGSQDSIGSSISANGKKKSGDDISLSSLKEFEGLEYACVETEQIEERARAEERMLSQIEEGHESQASESESCETLEKSCYAESDDDEDYDQKMFEIDEIIRQAQSNVEKFADIDRIEKTESLGRGDSFEETARIPDFELDQPLTENTPSSSEIYSGKKYIEHFDISHSLTTSTDSLEPKCKPEDILVTSTDSLEATTKSKQDVVSDSLECTRVESPRSTYDADEELRITVGDDPRLSPHHLMLSSPDSLDATSSAATHATYQNETDSAMSSSFTSAGSNTMVSSTENLENIVTNYSNWLDGNPYMTEVVYNISEKSYVTTERVTETPTEMKITSQGQDAKKLYDKDMAAFKPGEYYTETQEIDSEGNVHIKRVIESRAVVTSEKVQNTEKIILNPEEYRSSSDVTVSHFVTRSNETYIESGIKTETTVRQEKKEVSGDVSSDKTKS